MFETSNMVKKKSGGEVDIKSAKGRKGKLDLAKKARFPVLPSIGYALKNKAVGTVFSTPAAGRIYVITKSTWGDENPGGKVVKGFTADTPSNEIRAYTKRTKVKHGPDDMPDTAKGKAQKGYATRKFKDLKKRKTPLE
jgi:hypothetical protein